VNGAVLVSAAAMGLVGSTHCVAMCGGVAAALGGRPARALAYNLGRTLSYAGFGAVAGGFGAMTSALPLVRDAQIGLRILSAVLLLGAGLWLAGVFGLFGAIERVGAPAWRRLAGVASRLTASRRVSSALGLGLVWGLMPCGLVYAALALAAATGEAREGALAMAAFGAGTLPLLLAVGVSSSSARRLARGPWARRAAGVVLCLSALVQLQGARALAASEARGAACCHAHR